ncbi:GerMN domain-containing protein [Paractinoplanes ferrugineus]|uniref:GerMN domain-containing protein n=1 Tax=Paractinoplanes ferrugineus TaxID=113564 RepID=UPI001EF36674|nr:GerMN domain-containing protein [Actinoplanes ferrugineus]
MKRLLLAVVLLAAGCGVPVDDEPRDLDRPRTSVSSAPVPDRFGSALERVYLVRDGALVRVVRRVPVAPSAQQMLADLLAGPSSAEQRDGFTSALTTTRIGGMTITQHRATVAVAEPSEYGGRTDEMLAYGQIVCTLTSQGAEVGTVQFTSGGSPLSVPRGDGSLSTGPLTIADYADLLTS